MALHAGIPQNILKHTEWAPNYFNSTNKYVAVGYGILRGTGDIFRHNASQGVDYYEVDRGYINPNHFDGYYRISKNGLQAVYSHQRKYPSDRLDKLKFTIAEKSYHNPKGRIIICPPTEYIEEYYNLTPGKWLKDTKTLLNNKSVKVREKGDTTPLEHDLMDASCVITFNSNVAVDASLKRIPVIAPSYSIAHKWTGNDVQSLLTGSVNVPSVNQVEKLLRFASYNQFTLEEIKGGIAWRMLHA
jgi:hypothetical protein